MLFHPNRIERLANVADRLNKTTAPSAVLLYAVLSTTDRTQVASQGVAAAHIAQLIECGAWTEAAMELLNLCCPRWQLSRLIYDNGEWHCCLSPERELPDWLGQTIETRHEYLAMALLKAVLESSQYEVSTDETPTPIGPPRAISDNLVLCEDFF